MSEFKKVQAPRFSPTKCAFCGAHEGPFIDTEVEHVGYGHIYVCASTDRRSGCVQQMARLDGMISAEEIPPLTQVIQALEDEVKNLRDVIAGNSQIDLADLLEMYGVRLPVESL